VNEKKKRSEKKKGKKKSPSGKASLLTRLFGGRQKKRPKPPSKEKAKPLTPMQRSIAEIQQMTKIGQRDPERLAQLLLIWQMRLGQRVADAFQIVQATCGNGAWVRRKVKYFHRYIALVV
jgi:hypothetical protein